MLPLEAMLVFMASALAEGCVDVRGPRCHQSPGADAGDPMDAQLLPGPCYCQESGRGTGSVLPLTVKGKKVFCSGMTTDTQLRKRDTEGFCDNPYPTTPTKSNGLKRKPSKSSLGEGEEL